MINIKLSPAAKALKTLYLSNIIDKFALEKALNENYITKEEYSFIIQINGTV